MTKEVDIIKKAMADNKKVFLKEMKQLNDKIDNLDKRLTKHIDFIERVYGPLSSSIDTVSYTHLTLPTNSGV